MIFTPTVILIIAMIITGIAGYLCGSVSSSVILSKAFFGNDVRSEGSGNAGATNIARVFGMKAGVFTLICDVLKCVIAMLIGYYAIYLLAPHIGFPAEYYATVGKYIAAGCCITGHAFPVFYGFKGGKGISVGLAIGFGIDWKIGVVIIIVFAVTFAISRIVSLSSVFAAISFIITGVIVSLVPAFYLPKMLISVYTGVMAIALHHANIGRLIRGEEKKFSPKKKDK